jgi:hypothetical protein
MKNEKDVKEACKKLFKKYGVYYYMPVPVAYSRTGVPDFLCCVRGHFVGVETKYGYNKPSPRQEIEMQEIRNADGTTFVVNEKNIEELGNYLKIRSITNE